MPEDVEAVVEWFRWEDGTCRGCGHQMSQTHDPEMQGAYEAVVSTCHACRSIELARDKDEAKTAGASIGAVLRPEAVEFLRERE